MNEALTSAPPTTTSVGSDGAYLTPVSGEQRRLWYLAQKSPADTSYVMAYRLTLEGLLAPDTVEAALRDVVARHEILRSRIIAMDGVPQLFVSPAVELRLERRCLGALPPDVRADEAERQAHDLARTPFSLTVGPLLRTRLLRFGADHHQLLIAMHHIIGDGWSHSVLIQDFCAFYRQRSERLQHGLPTLPLQFSDYALWQQEFERSEACEQQVDHWVREVGPTPQDVCLPSDGSGRGDANARQRREQISRTAFDQLKARCREDRVLLSSVCLAAYQAALAYFADQYRFVTGLVTANRTIAETADLVGFFANTLIVPAVLYPSERFDALLRRVNAQMVEVQANQQAPFDRVVERIGLSRNWEDIAPVSALFVLQNAPASAFALPGIGVSVERLAVAPAKFPLTLFVIEDAEGLTFELEYAPASFSDAAMENLGALLKAHAVAYAEGRPMQIDRPDLPAECAPSRISGPTREVWTQTAVPDLIAARARVQPEAIAVESAGGRLSYRELAVQAERYGAQLQEALDAPGPVAISLPRSAELLVAILAVMRLGRAWVPVDPQAPEAYRSAGAGGLGIVAVIGGAGPDGVVCLAAPEISPGTAASSPPPAAPSKPLKPDQLAYIISTSGSTGRPKHVHVEHGGLANVCCWIAEALALGTEDKGIWKTHIEFDAVNREIFPILIAGGTLVIGPPEAQSDMTCLADTIAGAGVTHLHCVPGQLAALQSGPGLPASLRAVMCGGEVLPGRLAQGLLDQRTGLRIFNVYGPTETTVDVTAFEVGNPGPGPVPIGAPLPNVTVEIRRQDGAVPIGAVGELWVAGPHVAQGITSADGGFLSFGPPQARWFNTGDRAVLGGDGALRFLGRADRQFKRNGVRVEPAALERVLESHPGVAAAQVIPFVSPEGAGQLAAFVCPHSCLPGPGRLPEPGPVQVWKSVFEASYEGIDTSLPPVENTHGWIDSASRDSIPPQDVLAVIDLAAARILRWRPRRILELGCGIGTLGFRIAAEGARYLGVDFAESAIDIARTHARTEGIEDAQFETDDLESFTPPPDIRFDAIVLNSVVQYLPDEAALIRLLERAMTWLDGDGFVFLGDLRDARLDEAKALWRLSHAMPSGVSLDERSLAARIEAMRDDELTLAPSRLAALAEALGCAPPLLELKSCPGQNELVRFRYDATLVRRGSGSKVKATNRILARHEARNVLVIPYLDRGHADAHSISGGPETGGGGLRDLSPSEFTAEMEQRHPDARILCAPGDRTDLMVCLAVPRDLNCAELCPLLPVPRSAAPSGLSQPWHSRKAQIEGLDAYLNAHLPSYLRPDRLIALPEMPQLANGKRALGAMRLLAEAAQRRPHGPVPDAGSNEAAIASVFERLLGRRVGADDTFFAAGGNSLLATQACSQIARILGRPVPLKLFFDHASPRRLARALPPRRGAIPNRIARRANVTEAVPSFAQRRLWFIEKLGTARTVYNIAHAARLSGPMDLVALARALGDLTTRHASLRATFPEIDGQPLVRIAPPESLAPIESLPPGLSSEAAIAAIQAARAEPFDLAAGPLFRVLHASLGPHEHLLAVLAHHIILDGWSMAVVLHDLQRFYCRHMDPDTPAPAPAPPSVDYFDLAAHQIEQAENGAYDAQIAYWTAQLAGAPPRLPLPSDLRESGRRSWEGGEVVVRIPKALVRRVQGLCAETGATEFMVLLAVFKILLFRVSGMQDLVVGTVVANRHLPETEELAGFLVNPLALRSKVEPDWSFRQLLGRVKETCIAAFENQDVPFEMLLEHLDTDRRSDYQAVFQVMFAMQNAPRAKLSLPGLTGERVRLSGSGAMFDLGLEIRAEGDDRIGVLEYAVDRFERRTAERMATRYVSLLETLLETEGRTIGTVPILDATEVAEIARFSRGPALPAVAGDSLPGRVAQIARTDPDRPALAAGETRHSYGALQHAVGRLAERLGRAGVTARDRVGLLLPRGPAVAAAYLAVQTCRAQPVYLNPALPLERLHNLVAQARLGWTLRDVATPALGPHGDVALPEDLFAPGGAHAPAPPDLSAAPAYATFTSGSSGHPKAVLISQGAIAARLRANDCLFGPIGEGDRFAHAYGFDYDGGLVSLFWPLTRGAETVFLPSSALGNMADLTARLAAERITVFDTIPAVLSMLYEAWPPEGLPDLRLVVTGGDSCPADLAARHFARTDAVFANQYGPCEGVVNASSAVVRTTRDARRGLTIGTPIPGADIFILDPSGGLSGIGIRGEMAIGGDWIADGYMDAPELTAERFVTRDLEGLGRQRFYLSGDLGRWRNSGEIEFLGRADRQVQIDGMRVDPAEIETVLASEADVQDARVLITERDDAKRVTAFVVPTVAATEEESTLQTRWAEAFDRLYRASADPDPMRDFCGWSDTATGDPLPPAQMNAWLDETLAVLRSAGARTVLELGAGLGLIARALAGEVDRYVATDLSGEACARLQAAGSDLGFSALEVRRMTAEEAPAAYAGSRFDLIVLNSVVQYLPGADTLRTLLGALLPLLTPNGMLFVGDVRDLRLRRRFYCRVQARRAAAGVAASSAQVDIRRQETQDEELYLDPGFFVDVARSAGSNVVATVLHKSGAGPEELVDYRFDVILRRSDGRRRAPATRAFTDIGPGGIAAVLDATPGPLRVHRVRRLGPDAAFHAWLSAAQTRNRAVALLGEADPATCTVFVHDGAQLSADILPPTKEPEGIRNARLASMPSFIDATRRLHDRLRAALTARLPAHMVPSRLHFLPEFPMRDGAKVDEKALLELALAEDYGESDGGREDLALAMMRDIWSDIIGAPVLTDDADFFGLGGHSLLAARLAARIEREFRVRFPVIRVFELRRLDAIADAASRSARRRQSAEIERLDPIVPAPPPSAHQRAILARLANVPSDQHHIALALDLADGMRRASLCQALEEVSRAHPILRRRYPGLTRAVEREACPRLDVVAGGATDFADWLSAGINPLSDGPLMLALAEDSDGKAVRLALKAHPFAFDGASVQILLRDLARACRVGPDAEPRLAPCDYAAFAALEEADGTRGGGAFPEPMPWSGGSDTVTHLLAVQRVRAIDTHAGQLGVTPASVYLATYARALFARGLLNGTGIACSLSARARLQPAMSERLIGPLAHDLPVDLAGLPDLDPEDGCQVAAERLAGLFAHDDNAPGFGAAEAGFSYRHRHPTQQAGAGLVRGGVRLVSGPQFTPIRLSLVREGARVRARLSYPRSLLGVEPATDLLHDCLPMQMRER